MWWAQGRQSHARRRGHAIWDADDVLRRARIVSPVLCIVHSDFRAPDGLPRESYRAVDRRTLLVLDVAELGSTSLACVEAHLFNLATALEQRVDHVLCDVSWQAAYPDGAAVFWSRRLGEVAVLASAVSCDGLVLSVIHAYGDAFEYGACQFHSLVHGVCFKEFDMAEVAISQLVHLQANHLNGAAWLEQIDHVLLVRVNGQVPKP